MLLNHWKNQTARISVIIVLLFSLIEFYMYALNSKLLIEIPHLMYIDGISLHFIGPTVFYFVISATNPKKIKIPLYLIAGLLLFLIIGLSPDLFVSGEKKIKLLLDSYQNNDAFKNRKLGYFPPQWIQIFAFSSNYFLLIYSLYLFNKFLDGRFLRELLDDSNRTYYRWIGVFIIVGLFYLTLLVAQYIALLINAHFNAFIQILQSISLIVAKGYLIIYPQAIQGLVQNNQIIEPKEVDSTYLEQLILPKFIENIEFNELHKQLSLYFQQEKSFLNPNYSVKDLASYLKMSTRKASKAIELMYGISFKEFINRYRVYTFIENLSENDYKNYKIDSLILKSGFEHRSTFYSVFRRLLGVTPSQFIEKWLDDSRRIKHL